MKIVLLCCLATGFWLRCFGTHALAYQSPSVRQSQDLGRLVSVRLSFAKEFVQFLNEHGFTVKAVHHSHLESFFQDVERAAYIETDMGIIEVIFFPEPKGAEKIKVTEVQENGRYLYSFQGQPKPTPPGDTIDANRRIYFMAHGNLFIQTDDEKIHDSLKRTFLER